MRSPLHASFRKRELRELRLRHLIVSAPPSINRTGSLHAISTFSDIGEHVTYVCVNRKVAEEVLTILEEHENAKPIILNGWSKHSLTTADTIVHTMLKRAVVGRNHVPYIECTEDIFAHLNE